MNVAHDGFELVDVSKKALAPPFGNAINRLNATGGAMLFSRYYAELRERVHVPVQIPIRKIASRSELRETQTARMGD
jgi:hypothetical protein